MIRLTQMRDNFEMLDGIGKKHIIIFTVMTVLSLMLAIGYAADVYSGMLDFPPYVQETDLYVDGSNFGWLLPPIAASFSGLLLFANLVVSVLFTYGINLLAYGLFRFFAFRDVLFVSDFEYALAKQLLAVLLIAGGVLALLVTRFHLLLLNAILLFPTGLFSMLFCILPLKHKMQTDGDDIP